jgi:hypothetical protein
MLAMPQAPISTDEIAELVGRLTASPIFAMSLGSKELFHSNLLAWFIDRHAAVAKAICAMNAPTVERERNHTDLLIRQDGCTPIVIENKVFSLPDEAQLERISTKMSSISPRTVLLSLTSPGWPGGQWTSSTGQCWRWMSYAELITLLRPTVSAVTAADSYAGETLSRWLHLMGLLEELVKLVGLPGRDEPVSLPANLRAELAQAKLDAPIQKMRFHGVRLALAPELAGVEAGMTRGEGLVQWFVRDEGELWWGWQLQGEQFRLALIVPKGHPGNGDGSTHRVIREQEAAAHPEFYAFGEIPGSEPQHSAGFLHYKPGFVYRYVKVPGITVGEAATLGREHAKRIAALSSGSPESAEKA